VIVCDNILSYTGHLAICAAETGACFIVFNVPVNHKTCKTHCSIIEDGILVRLPRHVFDALQTALRSAENFSITDSESGNAAADTTSEELVVIRWTDDASGFDLNERLGCKFV